ncbi:hypothetical protein [Solibacillus daqui]|uniref:hypothetical protein n=1 Tax=Solibacillus daqui TaxID=2912187 RepID=UPI002365FF4B|nr:hypothetical protein [Solibacillus daqui]
MENKPNDKLINVNQNLPPNHPFNRIKESTPMPLDMTQKLTKLKEILPANHPIILALERNSHKK